MASSHRPKPSRSSTSSRPRPSTALTKTEIIINIYDLLPPGGISSVLWPLGLSLLHTGIVLNNREYSYGAVSNPASPSPTGVFWASPRLEPPGGTFRCSLLQGFTYLSPPELEALIKDVSARFLGNEYNLLRNNCNHFTNYVCRVLTQREAPPWLNRASKVGILLPCLVPSDWIEPPTADEDDEGPFDDDDDVYDERYGMLRREANRQRISMSRDTSRGRVSDVEGRGLPASEQAPRDRLVL